MNGTHTEQDATRQAASGSLSAQILSDLFRSSSYADYVPAAAPHERTWWGRLLSVLVVAAMTTTGVWAARELVVQQADMYEASAELREQVQERLTQTDELSEEVDTQRALLTHLQQSVLPEDPERTATLEQLGIAAGTVEVTGPGIVVTLDDTNATTEEGLVTDFDLQVLVNGLWASGAEAVAINGQRLGQATAVRSAGTAILVNLTPLTPPYQVEAIGDPEDLQVQLARTRAAGHLAVLRDTYGIQISVATSSSLLLNAAAEPALSYASVPDGTSSNVK